MSSAYGQHRTPGSRLRRRAPALAPARRRIAHGRADRGAVLRQLHRGRHRQRSGRARQELSPADEPAFARRAREGRAHQDQAQTLPRACRAGEPAASDPAADRQPGRCPRSARCAASRKPRRHAVDRRADPAAGPPAGHHHHPAAAWRDRDPLLRSRPAAARTAAASRSAATAAARTAADHRLRLRLRLRRLHRCRSPARG